MGIEAALLAVAVIGTAASINEQQRAAKAQKRSLEAEKRKAEVENVRSIRQQVRAARIAEASIINQSAISGTVGSSGQLGGVSSARSQLGGNLDYMSSIAEENTTIFNETAKAAKASSNAAIYGQIGSMSRTIFSDVK